MNFCGGSIEIEVNGEPQTLRCSQNEGHLENHSAKVWWSDEPDSEPARDVANGD